MNKNLDMPLSVPLSDRENYDDQNHTYCLSPPTTTDSFAANTKVASLQNNTKNVNSSENLYNKDLPLQSAHTNQDCGSQIIELLSPSSHSHVQDQQLTQLKQRNFHLELELQRYQSRATDSDDFRKMFNELKEDYKLTLRDLERSEEIRREQKSLINDQKA